MGGKVSIPTSPKRRRKTKLRVVSSPSSSIQKKNKTKKGIINHLNNRNIVKRNLSHQSLDDDDDDDDEDHHSFSYRSGDGLLIHNEMNDSKKMDMTIDHEMFMVPAPLNEPSGSFGANDDDGRSCDDADERTMKSNNEEDAAASSSSSFTNFDPTTTITTTTMSPTSSSPRSSRSSLSSSSPRSSKSNPKKKKKKKKTRPRSLQDLQPPPVPPPLLEEDEDDDDEDQYRHQSCPQFSSRKKQPQHDEEKEEQEEKEEEEANRSPLSPMQNSPSVIATTAASPTEMIPINTTHEATSTTEEVIEEKETRYDQLNLLPPPPPIATSSSFSALIQDSAEILLMTTNTAPITSTSTTTDDGDKKINVQRRLRDVGAVPTSFSVTPPLILPSTTIDTIGRLRRRNKSKKSNSTMVVKEPQSVLVPFCSPPPPNGGRRPNQKKTTSSSVKHPIDCEKEEDGKVDQDVVVAMSKSSILRPISSIASEKDDEEDKVLEEEQPSLTVLQVPPKQEEPATPSGSQRRRRRKTTHNRKSKQTKSKSLPNISTTPKSNDRLQHGDDGEEEEEGKPKSLPLLVLGSHQPDYHWDDVEADAVGGGGRRLSDEKTKEIFRPPPPPPPPTQVLSPRSVVMKESSSPSHEDGSGNPPEGYDCEKEETGVSSPKLRSSPEEQDRAETHVLLPGTTSTQQLAATYCATPRTNVVGTFNTAPPQTQLSSTNHTNVSTTSSLQQAIGRIIFNDVKEESSFSSPTSLPPPPPQHHQGKWQKTRKMRWLPPKQPHYEQKENDDSITIGEHFNEDSTMNGTSTQRERFEDSTICSDWVAAASAAGTAGSISQHKPPPKEKEEEAAGEKAIPDEVEETEKSEDVSVSAVPTDAATEGYDMENHSLREIEQEVIFFGTQAEDHNDKANNDVIAAAAAETFDESVSVVSPGTTLNDHFHNSISVGGSGGHLSSPSGDDDLVSRFDEVETESMLVAVDKLVRKVAIGTGGGKGETRNGSSTKHRMTLPEITPQAFYNMNSLSGFDWDGDDDGTAADNKNGEKNGDEKDQTSDGRQGKEGKVPASPPKETQKLSVLRTGNVTELKKNRSSPKKRRSSKKSSKHNRHSSMSNEEPLDAETLLRRVIADTSNVGSAKSIDEKISAETPEGSGSSRRRCSRSPGKSRANAESKRQQVAVDISNDSELGKYSDKNRSQKAGLVISKSRHTSKSPSKSRHISKSPSKSRSRSTRRHQHRDRPSRSDRIVSEADQKHESMNAAQLALQEEENETIQSVDDNIDGRIRRTNSHGSNSSPKRRSRSGSSHRGRSPAKSHVASNGDHETQKRRYHQRKSSQEVTPSRSSRRKLSLENPIGSTENRLGTQGKKKSSDSLVSLTSPRQLSSPRPMSARKQRQLLAVEKLSKSLADDDEEQQHTSRRHRNHRGSSQPSTTSRSAVQGERRRGSQHPRRSQSLRKRSSTSSHSSRKDPPPTPPPSRRKSAPVGLKLEPNQPNRETSTATPSSTSSDPAVDCEA